MIKTPDDVPTAWGWAFLAVFCVMLFACWGLFLGGWIGG